MISLYSPWFPVRENSEVLMIYPDVWNSYLCIYPIFMAQFCRSIFQHHGSHLGLDWFLPSTVETCQNHVVPSGVINNAGWKIPELNRDLCWKNHWFLWSMASSTPWSWWHRRGPASYGFTGSEPHRLGWLMFQLIGHLYMDVPPKRGKDSCPTSFGCTQMVAISFWPFDAFCIYTVQRIPSGSD